MTLFTLTIFGCGLDIIWHPKGYWDGSIRKFFKMNDMFYGFNWNFKRVSVWLSTEFSCYKG